MARAWFSAGIRFVVLAGGVLTLALAGAAAEPPTPVAGGKPGTEKSEQAASLQSTDKAHTAAVPAPSDPCAKTLFTTAAFLPVNSVNPSIASMPAPPVLDAPPMETLVFEEAKQTKPAIEVRGRIHADAILVNQSQRNQAVIGDVQDATGFRRARLGAQGFVGEQVNWVAEFDFAGGTVSFKDVFAAVDELPLVKRVRIGRLGEPFSLEGATNSNYFTFAERSPIMALDPARTWGISVFSYTENQRTTLAVGAFRSGASNASGDDFGDRDDMAYTARATILPWFDAASDGRYLLHLGAAFSQRFPHDDVVAINQGPQSNLLPISDNPGSPFLPTITVPASQQQLYNLEAALVLGPWSFQAEWSATHIDQIGGGPVFLHGCYVFASYFLTGENRHYATKDGTFAMTKVRSPFLCLNGKESVRGPGAWEVTARLAYVDFADANIPPSNGLKVGDRDVEFTIGLNWYLNDYMRIMFNYVHAVPVDPNFGPSVAEAFIIRAAIFW